VRVLVTGGAGFVGSHVVDTLVEAGHEVRVLDTAPAGRNGAEHVRGDLRDAVTVRRATAGVDAVCHHAAMVGLGVDFADAPAYVSHNDAGTVELLAALHAQRFRGRFVLASSMVVYGEGCYRCVEHGAVRPGPRDPARLDRGQWDPDCPACGAALTPEPVPEGASTDPRSVYAATKLHQEHLCGAFGREHAVTVTSLRYHNVYGPRMPRDTPYAGVAAIFGSAVEAGRPPRVLEDGKQQRDFVHVRDVARANLLALTADPPVDGPVNIASGTPRTVLDLARALVAATSNGGPPPEVVGGYRPGDVRHVYAATTRARRELGFTAQIALEHGVTDLASAVVEHRNGAAG
jgi:dTDP-L-rhamnose 4-epimerase